MSPQLLHSQDYSQRVGREGKKIRETAPDEKGERREIRNECCANLHI